MQAIHGLPRPLVSLLTTQLGPAASSSSSSSRVAAALGARGISAAGVARHTAAARPYATDSNADFDYKQKMAELQAKQVRMAEKAGRMKRSVGMIAPIPIFANHIPPEGGRTFGAGTPASLRWQYFKSDAMNDMMSMRVRFGWRKVLGTKWLTQFNERALLVYKVANTALTTGNYDKLLTLASTGVVDNIKARRAGKLAGLRLSWKLHKLVSQEIVCARQQEVYKQDEHVGQVAVRFVTEQSLEIRDASGKLVGSGRHDQPETVTEYCIFQRDMWRPDDDWTVVKMGARETDLIRNPAQQP